MVGKTNRYRKYVARVGVDTMQNAFTYIGKELRREQQTVLSNTDEIIEVSAIFACYLQT